MKNISVLASIALLSTASLAGAATLLDVDFEGANDVGFSFGFSENNAVPITNDQNSPNGNNGTEGLEFAITGTAAASFAGAGFGAIDLGIDPSIVAGSITAAQLDSLLITFDSEVIGTGINTARFEASLAAGDFANKVDIPTPTGAYSNYTVDFSTLDPGQKSDMLTSLNTNNVTALNFAFSFTPNGAGEFVAGDTVRFDNFTATTIPEPSSALILTLACSVLAMRRRR